MKQPLNFWETMGFISFLLFAAGVIIKINEETSTKLYDQKALKDLEDPIEFERIYGRPKD